MRQRLFGIILCGLIFTAGLVAAFSTGPPDGRTGAPGESNCTVSCHSSFALNSGSGVLTITGPATYQPNGSSIMTISIAHTGQSRWGFEATALDTNNNFVGFFMDVEAPDRVQISTGGAREYVKHMVNGTDAGVMNTSPGWLINWQAPTTNVGPVTIYVAGNAANNNGFNSGDFIYTKSITINPVVSSCCIADRGNANGGSDDGTLAGSVTVADLVFLVAFMFQGGAEPDCMEEADINGSGGAAPISVTDLVALVAFMFQGGTPPAPCP